MRAVLVAQIRPLRAVCIAADLDLDNEFSECLVRIILCVTKLAGVEIRDVNRGERRSGSKLHAITARRHVQGRHGIRRDIVRRHASAAAEDHGWKIVVRSIEHQGQDRTLQNGMFVGVDDPIAARHRQAQNIDDRGGRPVHEIAAELAGASMQLICRARFSEIARQVIGFVVRAIAVSRRQRIAIAAAGVEVADVSFSGNIHLVDVCVANGRKFD